MNFQPVIKWSGSKRSQCNDILKEFPSEIDTYYEPFCGGCSVLMALMMSDIKVKRYVCSDINGDLIELWNTIKTKPAMVLATYNMMWLELNKDNDLERKKAYFNEKRKFYNQYHDLYVFFFIMRTVTNGMPRYNSKGEFNNTFHVTRNGMEPKRIQNILYQWSELLNKNNVEFRHCSYEKILDEVKENDFVYMDPPYFSTSGMYYGGLNYKLFFNFVEQLNNKNVKFALSFDGKSAEGDNTYNVPKTCYTRHMYLKSGNSSFRRTIGKKTNVVVYESLYLNYDNEV